MKHYNIAFVGMGSIGRRHLSNLTQIINEEGSQASIDLYRNSLHNELPQDIISLTKNQFLLSEPITKHYNCVFITNPTSLHKSTIRRFRNNTDSFFIEKPVFDSISEDTSEFKDLKAYVASPLRYNPVLQYIKQNLDLSKVISVRAMSSSYLPEWRPGQDYRTSYSAHADMGGGVDIDLVHEWDYLSWIFGMPTECYGIAGKFSNLEIDSYDTAIYIARNNKITFELHLDYFGRKAQRTLDIFTHDDTIRCDILNGSISFLKENRILNFNNERNNFQLAEIKHFLNIINDLTPNDSTIQHANQILKLSKARL